MDSELTTFGVREAGHYFDDKIKAQVFTVNGQKVFIKGGNWIASDALLRLSEERYEAEVRFHAGMNMNMIRVWGGGLTERLNFMMPATNMEYLSGRISGFPATATGNGIDPTKKESQARRKAYPDNHTLFLESVKDQIKMLQEPPQPLPVVRQQ